MSLTFYYAPMSTASITEAVLAELGTPCEKVKLDFRAGETKKPEFLAVNPNAKVPAIVHDGTSIWESSAITMYLGEAFGVDAKLYPTPGPKRGEAMKWIAWSNVSLAEAAGRVMMNTADFVPVEKRHADVAEGGKKDVVKCLEVLDGSLAKTPFLLGSDYSLVDTHVHAIVGWIAMLKIDVAPYTNVVKWMKACGERPAIAKLWQPS